MPKQKVTVKNQRSGLKQSFINLSRSSRGKFILFLVTFAVIGGSYMAYRSFAAVSTPVFYLNNGNDGSSPEAVFAFGNPGDKPIACDWDGNRSDGIGVWQEPSVSFHLSDTLSPTNVTKVIPFGNKGDMPVCGDWNGDKKAGVGVFRPGNGTWYLADTINKSNAGRKTTAGVTKEVRWGDPGDIPLVCDWNGDGKDDIGVYRPSNAHFYLSYSTLGWTDQDIHFGNPGDQPVCGNWDGVGGDGIGVYRPSNATFYLSDTIAPTKVNRQFVYGNSGDKAIVGDWDADGVTSVGIYRMADLPPAQQPKPAKTTYTCVGDTVIEVKDKATCDAILTYARLGRSQPPAPTPPPPAAVGTPLLQAGSSGDAVSSLQQRLANRGFWIATTGQFNDATVTTVKWFQGARGITADGIVGPQTWGQLAAAEAEGWIFNPGSSPPPPATQPVSVGQPPALSPEVIAYLEALKRAEDQARRDELFRVHNPPDTRTGVCYMWIKQVIGWKLWEQSYLQTRQACKDKPKDFQWGYQSYSIHHIDWMGPSGVKEEVWTRP